MKAKATPPYIATAEKLKGILTSEQASAIAGMFLAPPETVTNPVWFDENINKFTEREFAAHFLLAYFMHESRPAKVKDYFTS